MLLVRVLSKNGPLVGYEFDTKNYLGAHGSF